MPVRRAAGVEEATSQNVGLVDDRLRPGEVERRTAVGRPGEDDDFDVGRRQGQLPLEALVAGDGEGP